MSSRILIVDDEPGVTSALRRTLARADRQVKTCNNPTEALACLNGPEAFVPDVVFSDVRMPDMHGPEMLQVMRLDLPDACFMIMSGDDQDVANVAMEQGTADLFMPKPWDNPRLDVYLAMASAVQYQRRARTESRIISAPCTVLVSTTDRTLGSFLRYLAAARGHQVTIAKDGSDALAHLRARPTEVIMVGLGRDAGESEARTLLDVRLTVEFLRQAHETRDTYQLACFQSPETLHSDGVNEADLMQDEVLDGLLYLDQSGEALYLSVWSALQQMEDTFMKQGAG